MSVDAGAANEDIVDDGEAAFTTDPFALAVLQAAIGQDSSLVQSHAAAVVSSGQREFLWMKKLPHGPIDYLVRCMTEDVDNGVGRVQYVGVIGEVVNGDEGGIHGSKNGGSGRSCSTARALVCRI